MKIKKKLLIKIISALCAANAMAATAPALASAHTPKKSLENGESKITEVLEPNVNNVNVIANDVDDSNNNSVSDIDEAIRQIIVDKDSQNSDDKTRNEQREKINAIFLGDDDEDESNPFSICSLKVSSSRSSVAKVIARISKNPFDRFFYLKMATLVYSKVRYEDPLYNEFLESHHTKNQAIPKFESTKKTLANKLIDQEKDLVRQLLLQLVCSNILNVSDPMSSSNKRGIDVPNPYRCKLEAEKRYKKWLSALKDDDKNKSYEDFEDFDDAVASLQSWKNFDFESLRNKLAQYINSDEFNNHITDCQVELEASEKAMSDVRENKMTNVKEKSKLYQDAYNQTYAFALAENDVKQNLEKRQNLEENLQQLYNEQYNECIKQIGNRDGGGSSAELSEIDSDEENVRTYQKYEDKEIQKFYDQGYFDGVLKEVKWDVMSGCLNINKYPNEARNIYLKAFESAAYEYGVYCFENFSSPKFQTNIIKHIPDFKDKTLNVADIEAKSFDQYIKGCLKGCQRRGYKYAIDKDDNYAPKSLDQSKLGKHYEELKKAYDQGLKEGLAKK